MLAVVEEVERVVHISVKCAGKEGSCLCLRSGTNSMRDLGQDKLSFGGLRLFWAMGTVSLIIKWLPSRVPSYFKTLLFSYS